MDSVIRCADNQADKRKVATTGDPLTPMALSSFWAWFHAPCGRFAFKNPRNVRALLAVASPAAQRPVLIAVTDLEASRSSVVDVISRFGHNPPCSRKNIDLQALSSQRPQVQLYALVDVRCLSALRRRYPEGCLIWETHGRDLRHGDRLEYGQNTYTGNDPLTADP